MLCHFWVELFNLLIWLSFAQILCEVQIKLIDHVWSTNKTNRSTAINWECCTHINYNLSKQNTAKPLCLLTLYIFFTDFWDSIVKLLGEFSIHVKGILSERKFSCCTNTLVKYTNEDTWSQTTVRYLNSTIDEIILCTW